MSIKCNVDNVKKNIYECAKGCGRNPEEITIIAVSKTFPAEDIEAVADSGLFHFGENKVQELSDKAGAVSRDVKWHFIGHLQSNKVKKIIGLTELIHSVDSLELAKEIDRQSKVKSVITDILVQVNISGEESKFGIGKNEIHSFIDSIKEMENIRIRGLMTIGPKTDDKDCVREAFRELNLAYSEIKNTKNGTYNVDFKYLSMGMSGDYEIGIEEGANMLRIGSAIFGKRTYL